MNEEAQDERRRVDGSDREIMKFDINAHTRSSEPLPGHDWMGNSVPALAQLVQLFETLCDEASSLGTSGIPNVDDSAPCTT